MPQALINAATVTVAVIVWLPAALLALCIALHAVTSIIKYLTLPATWRRL